MSRKPVYPEDAPVGDPVGGAGPAPSGEKASAPGDASARPAPGKTRHIVTGAAIGIGSAALVAALLYARRPKKDGPGAKG